MNDSFVFICQLLAAIIATLHPIATDDDFFDNDSYRWFTIVSKQKQCECELAIEIPTTRANCPLTKLIACPHDNTSIFQQWRWDGHMIKSRLNGLVWDTDSIKPRNIMLGHPINSSDQQFHFERKTKHIYVNIERFRKKKVVDLACRNDSYIGTEIIIFNVKLKNVTNQLFEFRPVY